MKLFSKSNLIEFYCDPEFFGVIPEPIPAYKLMPDWFKKAPVTVSERGQLGSKALGAKKCMPLLDAMSLGFIIPLFGDVNIRTNGTGSLIEVSQNPLGPIVEFHNASQLGGLTSPTAPGPAIKFINKWVIKTAPGYSTLFVPPLNVIEPRFTCLSGLVDTDQYQKEVNFPGIWHIKNYDDCVAAGTPLVVCFPVKRDTLTRSAPVRSMTVKEREAIDTLHKKQISRQGVYTNELRRERAK